MASHRSILAARVIALREYGYTFRQIAADLCISPSYASALVNDPDGSKDRARKDTYGQPCIDCGKNTDGSNGRAKAPERCRTCRLAFIEAPHGTASRYRSAGCRCDACRTAATIVHRRLAGKQPPNHGLSGYRNYQCRCDTCTAANTASQRRYQARKAAAS